MRRKKCSLLPFDNISSLVRIPFDSVLQGWMRVKCQALGRPGDLNCAQYLFVFSIKVAFRISVKVEPFIRN